MNVAEHVASLGITWADWSAMTPAERITADTGQRVRPDLFSAAHLAEMRKGAR